MEDTEGHGEQHKGKTVIRQRSPSPSLSTGASRRKLRSLLPDQSNPAAGLQTVVQPAQNPFSRFRPQQEMIDEKVLDCYGCSCCFVRRGSRCGLGGAAYIGRAGERYSRASRSGVGGRPLNWMTSRKFSLRCSTCWTRIFPRRRPLRAPKTA